LAHDVGTGPGQVAAELSSHFDKVVASDYNSTHLIIAKHYYPSLVSSKKIELVECSGEDILKINAPESLDLITAAECIPLMDTEKALESFSRALKNGTLAIWFYGRPIFAEPVYREACAPLYLSIVDHFYSKIISRSGPQGKIGWKRAIDNISSCLDDIEFKSDEWYGVERIKWNMEHSMYFHSEAACDFDFEVSSKVGPGEKIVEKKDLTFWERQWD
jgi:ubiquinone/menaquinone biosynthesis C-methylase UbiE